MTNAFLYRLARALPPHIQDVAEIKVRQAGLKEDSSSWLAQTLLLMSVSTLAGAIILYLAQPFVEAWLITLWSGAVFPPVFAIIVGVVLGFAIGIGARSLSLYYAIEHRRRQVEDILPDFLMMVAGNIRAGMTSFSAFKSSSRPEFGPLAEEVKAATSRSLGTESFGNALSTISERIQSKNVNETVRFFLQAIRSGGKVAQLLENTANDLRRTQDLKKELESSTRTYVIFVAFVMVIATPLLMAVSVEFVSLISKIQHQTPLASGDSSAALGFLGGTISISPAFLQSVAYILLFGNAVLAGLFMGTIGGGKPVLGLKYTPIMFAISIVAFFFAKGMLSGLLGTA